MDIGSLEQLEAELRLCENALARNLNIDLPSPPPRVQSPAKPSIDTSTRLTSGGARPKPTMTDLLDMLQQAPDGPFELDTSLLYSPTRSEYSEHIAHEDDYYYGSKGAFSPSALPVDGLDNVGLGEFRVPAFRPRDQQQPHQQQQDQKAASGAHSRRETGSRPSSGAQSVGGQELNDPLPRTRWSPRKSSSTNPKQQQFFHSNQTSQTTTRNSTRAPTWVRLELLRREREALETAECTFAPVTGRPPAPSYSRPWVPIHERLLLPSGGETRHRKAEQRILEERRVAEAAACTFTPQLVAPPRIDPNRPWKPVYERGDEERAQKLERLRNATARADADATFKPKLNENSLKMAEALREQGKVPGKKAVVVDDGNVATFAPEIDPVSRRMLEMSAQVPSDFDARVRHFQQRGEDKMRRVREQESAIDCTFQPDTGNATAVLAYSDRIDHLFETPEERWQRMAFEESAKIEAKRAQCAAELASKDRFEPHLNHKSLKLAQGRTLTDLVAEPDITRRKLHQLQTELEAEKQKECTFKPNTSKPRVIGYYAEYEPPAPNAALSIASALKEGPEALAQRLAEYRLQRAQREAAQRAAQEARELAPCTFTPDISKPEVPSPRGPVLVRGLDRFMEQKERAERQQRELEERANKVFRLKPKGSKGPTIPKPFDLASEARSQLRRKSGYA